MNLHDIVKKGSTNRSVTLRIIDSTDGTPETGVVYNTAGIDLWYRREGESVSSITEATLAALTTAHTDGGFLHISHGEYRLDLPDAAFATGAEYVDFGGTVTGMIVLGGRVRLIDVNLEDSVRAGLTAMPNAAADAAGGLPISDAGGLDMDAIAKAGDNMGTVSSVTGNVDGSVASVTDKAGFSLSTSGILAIWHQAASAIVSAGTIGKLFVDEITSARMATLTDWIDGGRLDLLLDDVPTTSEFEARTLAAADYFDPAADTVANVTTVATTTTNTDMRGTDDAALASVATEARLSELDAATGGKMANEVDGIKTEIGTAGAGLTDLGGMSTAMKAEVNAEADTAIADYDPPTNAEFEARTPTAAQLAYIVENAATGMPVTFTTSGGSTTAAVINQVDGASGSATDDQYNGRLLVFTNGTLKGVVTDITDYDGGTTTATITAIPFAPTASHTARLI